MFSFFRGEEYFAKETAKPRIIPNVLLKEIPLLETVLNLRDEKLTCPQLLILRGITPLILVSPCPAYTIFLRNAQQTNIIMRGLEELHFFGDDAKHETCHTKAQFISG